MNDSDLPQSGSMGWKGGVEGERENNLKGRRRQMCALVIPDLMCGTKEERPSHSSMAWAARCAKTKSSPFLLPWAGKTLSTMYN